MTSETGIGCFPSVYHFGGDFDNCKSIRPLGGHDPIPIRQPSRRLFTSITLPPTNIEAQGPFQEESSLSTGVCAQTHVSWWKGNSRKKKKKSLSAEGCSKSKGPGQRPSRLGKLSVKKGLSAVCLRFQPRSTGHLAAAAASAPSQRPRARRGLRCPPEGLSSSQPIPFLAWPMTSQKNVCAQVGWPLKPRESQGKKKKAQVCPLAEVDLSVASQRENVAAEPEGFWDRNGRDGRILKPKKAASQKRKKDGHSLLVLRACGRLSHQD